MTFDDGGRLGLEGEIVSASVNSPCAGDEFDHLIAYFMSFTLKDDVGGCFIIVFLILNNIQSYLRWGCLRHL